MIASQPTNIAPPATVRSASFLGHARSPPTHTTPRDVGVEARRLAEDDIRHAALREAHAQAVARGAEVLERQRQPVVVVVEDLEHWVTAPARRRKFHKAAHRSCNVEF